jgi:hypothetical protein
MFSTALHIFTADSTDWASPNNCAGMSRFNPELSAEACAEMLVHFEYDKPSPFYSLLQISNSLGWEGLAKQHHLLRGIRSTEMRTAMLELFGRSGTFLFHFERDRASAAKIVDEGIMYSYKIQFPTLDDGKQNLLGFLTEQTGNRTRTPNTHFPAHPLTHLPLCPTPPLPHSHTPTLPHSHTPIPSLSHRVGLENKCCGEACPAHRGGL